MSISIFTNHSHHINSIKETINKELACWQQPHTEFLLSQVAEFCQRLAKFIRPLMLVIICENFGGDLTKAYICGSAIELYHNATLMYDDIQDNSHFRRGNPTIHISTNLSFGMSVAGLTRTLMYHPINRCSEFTLEEKVYIHRSLDNACTQVTIGQSLETLWDHQKRWDIQETEYFKMINGKTATLFATCCQLGVYLGGRTQTKPQTMYDLGLELGVVFQLKNDYLDVAPKVSSIGRPLYNDLREGKRTLLVLRAISTLNKDNDVRTIDKLTSLLDTRQLTDEQINWCLDILHRTNSIQSIQGEITNRLTNIRNTIISLSLPSRLQKELVSLVDFLEAWGE